MTTAESLQQLFRRVIIPSILEIEEIINKPLLSETERNILESLKNDTTHAFKIQGVWKLYKWECGTYSRHEKLQCLLDRNLLDEWNFGEVDSESNRVLSISDAGREALGE